MLEDILSNVESLSQRLKKVESENSDLNKRVELLEHRSHMNEELEEQLEAIESRYKDLLTKLSSFRLSLNETFDSNLVNDERPENQRNSGQFTRDEINSSMRSHQRLGPIKTITVEVDHKNTTIELWANIREPIRNIKSRIREQENIAVECQCLLHDTQLLDNDKTLEEYGIKAMKFVLVKRPIKVDVIVFSQNLSFLLEPFDTISQLVEKIHKIKGFNVTLSYLGQTLDESRTFHSYRIRDRAKLKVNAVHCHNDALRCNAVHSL
ncbi:unnamed protein product [Oppiella nova]|uniref:Ubiquitin-like domain-containing protein n=1 Tax=Oppiella nova TaxID=334625 RepID=A0A7R9MSC3_9ACAR|nr:unnamed protein product [Oppiella nova]CAG2181504.1 unnamed protein product [Oppiella nova]